MVKPHSAHMQGKNDRTALNIGYGFCDEDILDFDLQLRSILGADVYFDYTLEPWIAGADVGLVYEKGKLTLAYIRGDENGGEDVTANMKTILTVPLALTAAVGGSPIPELLNVMGEVYVESSALKALNQSRVSKGFPPFANPHSAAVASLKQPNLRSTAKCPLNMFCFGVGDLRGLAFDTHYELMLSLQQWGLRVDRPHIHLCRSIVEVLEYCHGIFANGSQFPFQVVGAVIRVNQLQLRLGRNSNEPKWAVAYDMRALEG